MEKTKAPLATASSQATARGVHRGEMLLEEGDSGLVEPDSSIAVSLCGLLLEGTLDLADRALDVKL